MDIKDNLNKTTPSHIGYCGRKWGYNMKYTYEELQIMLNETEKAFDVMKKFAEVNNEFLMRKDIKPLYEKFLLDKLNK